MIYLHIYIYKYRYGGWIDCFLRIHKNLEHDVQWFKKPTNFRVWDRKIVNTPNTLLFKAKNTNPAVDPDTQFAEGLYKDSISASTLSTKQIGRSCLRNRYKIYIINNIC